MYQCDGRLVEQPLTHLVHHFRITGDAHIRDQSCQRSSLHARHGLGLGRRDSRVYPVSAALADLLTKTPQVLNISSVDGQSVHGDVIHDAVRVRPFLEGAQTAVEDVFLVRAGQVGVEGHVEGDVDEMARHCGTGAHGGAGHGGAGHGTLERWRRDGHGVLLMGLGPRHAEAHRGRHLLPAMAGLAGEV